MQRGASNVASSEQRTKQIVNTLALSMRPARLPLLLLSLPSPPPFLCLFVLLVVVADNVPQTIAIVAVVVAVVCYRFHSCSNQFDV